jgi:hypothetical protein
MTNRWHSYTAYGIGCAIVWVLLLSLVRAFATADVWRDFCRSCMGWWLGWLSATIARAVYPPTKAQQRAAAS